MKPTKDDPAGSLLEYAKKNPFVTGIPCKACSLPKDLRKAIEEAYATKESTRVTAKIILGWLKTNHPDLNISLVSLQNHLYNRHYER